MSLKSDKNAAHGRDGSTVRIQQEDRIAALSTPWGRSAVAVIRTSGNGCHQAVARLCRKPDILLNAEVQKLFHTHLYEMDEREGSDNRPLLDDVMLVKFCSPKSFTGEDMVEIHCHGSEAGLARIFEQLGQAGFRMAEPGEFSRRAFVNGKLDLTAAEAIHDIIEADSAQAHKMAQDRLSGTIKKAVQNIQQDMITLMAQVSVQLDYAEDEIHEYELDMDLMAKIRADIDALLDSYNRGRLFREGVKVVLAGTTNAGKSSLFNALLQEDRALVSEIHGTTRDYISSSFHIRGLPVHLHDTAGLRDGGELLEHRGMEKTRSLLEEADVLVYLIDGQNAEAAEECARYEQYKARCKRSLLIASKRDTGAPKWSHPDALEVSVYQPATLDALVDRLFTLVGAHSSSHAGSVVIASARQFGLLREARNALDAFEAQAGDDAFLDGAAMELQEALHATGQICGEVSSEDILDKIFSSFCLGK